jgi:hypothetical protein
VDGGGSTILLSGVRSSPAIDSRGALLIVQRGQLMAHPLDLARGTLGRDAVVLADGLVGVGDRHDMPAVMAGGVLAFQRVALGGDLVRLRPDGSIADVVSTADRVRSPMVSPDGQRVAVDVTEPVDGAGRLIWIHDLQRGVRTLVSERGSLADGPVWSANGEALYFNANLDGIWKIYRKTATGSGAPDLVGIPAGARDVSVLDASRDGRYLLATAVAGSESWDLYLLPLDRPENGWTAWASTPGAENSGRFSPDSRWIAYASTVSGVSEIYVSAVDDPWNRWQISSNGGLEPVWAAEGRHILYRTPADRLMAVDVELAAQGVRPGPPQRLFELHSVGDWSPRNVFDVMPDGTLLVLRRPAAYDATIHVRTAVPLGR